LIQLFAAVKWNWGRWGFVIEGLGRFGELFGVVGEGDLIDVDVAPAAGFVVDDLQRGFFVL